MLECNFQSQDIKAAYEEIRTVIKQPLYDLSQIESEIREVERVLQEYRIPSFSIPFEGIENNLTWNGRNLTARDLELKESPIMTFNDESKFIAHSHLPKILKKAMEVYREIKKKL